MWSNTLPDGQPDYRMKHAGLAPLKGIKYAVNCFINKDSQIVQQNNVPDIAVPNVTVPEILDPPLSWEHPPEEPKPKKITSRQQSAPSLVSALDSRMAFAPSINGTENGSVDDRPTVYLSGHYGRSKSEVDVARFEKLLQYHRLLRQQRLGSKFNEEPSSLEVVQEEGENDEC